MFKKLIELIKNVPSKLWIIALIALVLRLIGIWYGLPLQLNIDEPSLVSGALKLRQGFNLQRFDWPHLYFYMTGSLYLIYVTLRDFLAQFFNLPDEVYSPSAFFWISRLMSAIFGALTVFPLYYIGAKLFNSRKIGYISAILLAILPVHVYESHFAKIDVAHTFFIAIVVYFIVQIFQTGLKKYYILAGIFIGLSISIKYNGFLLFFPLLIAHLLRRGNIKNWFDLEGIKDLFLSGVASVVFFLLGTPYALFDHKRFLSSDHAVGALWQFQNVGDVTWDQYPIEVYETFFTMFRSDMGLFIWGLFLMLMVLFVFFSKRSKELILLLLPTVVFSFYISKFDRSPSHYFLMLIPLYIPALAAFIYEIWQKINSYRYFKWLGLNLFVFILIVPSLLRVTEMDILFARQDTRNMAYNWVKENLDENGDYLFVHGEDLETIPFKKNDTKRIKKIDRSTIEDKETPFYLVIGVDGVTKEMLLEGDRDPDLLEGNSSPILKESELLFEANNYWRQGTPIFIFRVDDVESADEEKYRKELEKQQQIEKQQEQEQED